MLEGGGFMFTCRCRYTGRGMGKCMFTCTCRCRGLGLAVIGRGCSDRLA